MLRAAALRAARTGLSLAQQRGFADKAVAAKVDWDSISAMVHSEEGKRELASLRSTFLDIQSRLNGMAEDVPLPDWNEWKKDLPAKIVDDFKTAFETMKLPRYEGKDAEEAQTRFEELFKQAEELAVSSAARVKEIEAELAAIAKEKARIGTTTVDEELGADPQLAAEIDSEIKRNNFLVTP